MVFAKARYITDDEILINQVKNFCCHVEVPEVKIYWSNVFVNNLYYTNSYYGKPAIIIGKKIYNSFTRNELNSLIYASLLRLKSKESQSRTIASLIFFILYSPVYFLRTILDSKRADSILDVFIYPAYFLKSKLYENEKMILDFDQEVGKLNGLKKDYIAALFKITHLASCNERSIGSLLMDELSHAKNKTDDVLNFLLIDHVSVEDRAKALK